MREISFCILFDKVSISDQNLIITILVSFESLILSENYLDKKIKNI